MRPIAALAVVAGRLRIGRVRQVGPSQTAGQRMDRATARAEQNSQAAKDDAKSAGDQMAQSTERVASEVSNKVKDAAITTAVNAKIAGDSRLSVIRINVDTVDGRVLLRGTAPDATAAEHAQQLAASVEGVVSVDNQLVISGKG